MLDAYWSLFLVASLAVIATPGQDMLLVMSRSITEGSRAGAEQQALVVCALGLVFAALTFVVKGPVALFAGKLATWFRRRPAALVWLYRTSGLVLIGLAVRLALARRP